MRPVRVAAVALIATSGLLLGACSSDDEPSAGNVSSTATATPSDTASASQSPSGDGSGDSDGGNDNDSTGASGDVSDFAQVPGFTLVSLPQALKQTFSAPLNNVPQIDGFEGRLAKKGSQQAGVVMRIGVDAKAADLPDFEDKFLPGFATGIAGMNAKPDFEKINGVIVVKIDTADGSGTAYAWIQDSVATVLVFQDASDAQAYAEGALS
jgi:hypothetical protein